MQTHLSQHCFHLTTTVTAGLESCSRLKAFQTGKPKLSNLPLLGSPALSNGLAVLQIRHFVDYFITVVDKWGPLGYLAYGVVYLLLEIVAVPAIPLTMTAGVIFGVIPGTIVVSVAATGAATIAFLIARYAARDRVGLLTLGILYRSCCRKSHDKTGKQLENAL